MAHKETGKGRSRRIELDYYKDGDDLRKLRRVLIVLALVVSVVWLISGARFRDGRVTQSASSRFRSSPGALASVHQAWNERCEACHKDSSSTQGTNPVAAIFATAPVTDATCKTCHSGPEHHPLQKKEDVKACAGCHFDHRGADNSLVKLADSECASCHEDISKHMTTEGQPSKIADVITSFVGNHPAFSTEAPGAKDPGRLKFNHALHLNAGLVNKPGDRNVKTLAYLTDPPARDRYRRTGQKDTDAIQLDCQSCHVTDASDFKVDSLKGLPRSATLPSRASGREMLPITYDNQCKACHPLSFDGRNPDLVAPHRAQPDAIRQFLWATYAGVFVADDQKLLAEIPQKKPIPGQHFDRDDSSVKQRIDKAVRAAEKVLYGGKTTCFECHFATKTTESGLPEAVEIANIPEFWLKNSRFNHTSHRAVNCRDCHVKAPNSAEATDILIPGIASCQECHNKPSDPGMLSFMSTSSNPKGGVRSDCTTCHRYHHADKPLLGRGTQSEKGTVAHDFAQFLSGESPK